ncbi:MAG: ribosome assembly RNA-binding protein YhbY [Deltaproteobacteria bacterium]|nr:MAG: ribosome assembly RNA-binding protein YhbY [Deltaproteobacteria bacterium]TMB26025.1 MAG: ribosome assembly RNA-binding protein YhbY [Deltaproteobacteria bacterium]TMB37180.1 MAG: ribosome assembly RNA-binding protein YhbY [Deltaproteobacteria bacterium]
MTGKQRRHLRALGHHLDPLLQIGHEGVTDAVVAQANDQLRRHELIKVRVLESSPLDRREAADELSARSGAALAQVLGRTFLLYKRDPEKPRIELP